MSLNDDIATFNESDFRIKLLAEYDGAVALDLTYTAGSVNIDFGLHFAARSDANQALIGFSSISEAGLGSRLGVNITSKSTPTIESRLIVAPSPPPPEFPPLSPGEELKETVGMWAIVAAEKDIAGKAVFDQGAFRRRMAQAWSVPTNQIALNVSVSTTNTSVAAVDSPTLASFSTQVNASVIAISNLYHSFVSSRSYFHRLQLHHYRIHRLHRLRSRLHPRHIHRRGRSRAALVHTKVQVPASHAQLALTQIRSIRPHASPA